MNKPAHIAGLAETEPQLPPILVDRRRTCPIAPSVRRRACPRRPSPPYGNVQPKSRHSRTPGSVRTPEASLRDPAVTVEKLLHDPSLRNNERGKGLLRLLYINAVGADQLPDAAIGPSAPIR